MMKVKWDEKIIDRYETLATIEEFAEYELNLKYQYPIVFAEFKKIYIDLTERLN